MTTNLIRTTYHGFRAADGNDIMAVTLTSDPHGVLRIGTYRRDDPSDKAVLVAVTPKQARPVSDAITAWRTLRELEDNLTASGIDGTIAFRDTDTTRDILPLTFTNTVEDMTRTVRLNRSDADQFRNAIVEWLLDQAGF